MNADTITHGVDDLRERYGTDVQVATDGARTLVRISNVALPQGCQPSATDLLLVMDPSQPKPLHYVRPGQTLSNGQPVQNSSTVLLAGESWMTFSFNVPYQEGDSLARFATAVRQRFGRP